MYPTSIFKTTVKKSSNILFLIQLSINFKFKFREQYTSFLVIGIT